MSDFLKEIFGEEGHAAMERTVERAPIFKSIIIPRAIIAWISTVNRLGYEGELPGTPNSYVSLAKNDKDTFTGALTIDGELYEFKDADMLHVAASVGVALGLEIEPINDKIKTKDLSKLGKSIDMLVKSRIVKNAKASLVKKEEEPVVETSIITPTKPISKVRYFRLSKSESEACCPECDSPQFKNNKFVGCLCLRALTKGIKTARYEDGYMLKFNMNDLDDEDVSTIISAFK